MDPFLLKIYNLNDDIKKEIYSFYVSMMYIEKKPIINHLKLYNKVKKIPLIIIDNYDEIDDLSLDEKYETCYDSESSNESYC